MTVSGRKLAGLLGLAPEQDLERRLLNWARWKLGVTDLALIHQLDRIGGSFEFGGGQDRSGYRQAVIPTLSGEALETDWAIDRLASPDRDAIHGHYCGSLPDGSRMPPCWTQADLAFRLGYPLRTFERVLAAARKSVADALATRARPMSKVASLAETL